MLPKEPLRIPAFRNLWLGQIISQVGDSLYFVVFMFMVREVSGQDWMVGVAGAAETLPFVLLGPTAGVFADRFDRRKIMLLSDILAGGLLLIVGLFVLLQPNFSAWLLVGTAFVLSTLRAVFLPAKSAALPALVPREWLLKANALSTATQNMVPIIGLALSATVLGVLYSISPTWFFATAVVVNAMTFLGSAVFIARLPEIRPERMHLARPNGWREFAEGLRYIRRRSELMALVGLGMMLNLFIAPFFVIFLAANALWFGGKPQTVALLELTFFVGMVFGSLWVAARNVRRAGLGYVWGLGVTGLTVALMTFAGRIDGAFYALGPQVAGWATGAVVLLGIVWIGLLNVLAGLAVPFAQIPTNTFVQATTPDGLRGRVNSVIVTTSIGMMPIGYALGGVLLSTFGVETMFLIMGLGMAGTALFGFAIPSFRGIEVPVGVNDPLPTGEEVEPIQSTQPA